MREPDGDEGKETPKLELFRVPIGTPPTKYSFHFHSLFSPPTPTTSMDAYTEYPYPESYPLWSFDDPLAATPSRPPRPPRVTLAGSLDPATGIFYRAPEHPRLRTAQACEKCRSRKAKCSGDHPCCARCLARGLVCEYAKEGRIRGPNKPKPRAGSISTSSGADLAAAAAAAAAKRRRRNTTLAMTTPARLAPDARFLPLPSSVPARTNGTANGGQGHDAPHPTPLNAHLLPSGSSKRFSLPASFAQPSSSGHPLTTLSSAFTYGHGDAEAEYAYPPDSAPSSAYTDSRRGSFDPSFVFGRAEAQAKGYAHEMDGGYAHPHLRPHDGYPTDSAPHEFHTDTEHAYPTEHTYHADNTPHTHQFESMSLGLPLPPSYALDAQAQTQTPPPSACAPQSVPFPRFSPNGGGGERERRPTLSITTTPYTSPACAVDHLGRAPFTPLEPDSRGGAALGLGLGLGLALPADGKGYGGSGGSDGSGGSGGSGSAGSVGSGSGTDGEGSA
ncbi:hypothetical protein C8R47DRAFT_1230968 [Mycena vitilis]|nr:hypothetical protein C8R47DRAFT_1230968 [Mycena vitilis]